MTEPKHDITDRLRECYNAADLADLADHMVAIKFEAAAEIDRLREEVAWHEAKWAEASR